MKQFTFISVPRTATNSIHKALKTDFLNNHTAAKMIDLKGFSFGFIRNPFEQLMSWFDYHKQIEGLKHIYGDSFDEWIIRGCHHHWAGEFMLSLGITHPCHQFEYFNDNVNHIALYENISNEWKYICQKLNIDVPLEYLNFSKSPYDRKKAEVLLSPEAKILAQKKFKQSFKLWNDLYAK